MVQRRNSSTGEPFLGCTRYPACRGTRPIAGAAGAPSVRKSTRPQRYRLSLGGRPKGIGDYTELIVARAVGRNLSKREGCLVQGVAIIVFAGLLYWFFTSGLFIAIVTAFSEWYAHQIKIPGLATPTPGT